MDVRMPVDHGPRLAAAIGDRLRARPGRAIGAALFAVMAVWSVLTPLFAGPDETSNMVKAAAVVRGELVGTGQPVTVQDSYFRTTVAIDPRFGNPNQIPWCFAPYPAEPACDRPMQDVTVVEDPPYTNVGRYPPVAFALPGVATVLGPTNAAVRAARLINAAWTAALLGIGVGIALRRSGRSTVTLLVVLSPMVLFLGSIVSPSGPEVSAGLALWMLAAPLLRGELTTRADRVGLWVVVVTLVTARPIGAVLALAIVAVVWAAHGCSSPAALMRRHATTVASAALAVAFMGVWYLQVFAVNLGRSVVADQPSIGATRELLRSLGHIPGLLAEMVGNFGWLDTPSPSLVVAVWLGAFGAVAVASAAGSHGRRRAAVLSVPVAAVALSVYLDIDYYRILRTFGVQGRHLLPLAFGVALVGSDRLRIGPRSTVVAAAVWVALQWTCGLFALRRYAVGVAPDNFIDVLRAPVWRPPLGVPLTLALLAAALAATATALVTAGGTVTAAADADGASA